MQQFTKSFAKGGIATAAVGAMALAGADSAAARVDAMLRFEAVVPAALAGQGAFRDALTGWLEVLEARGALAALTDLAEGRF